MSGQVSPAQTYKDNIAEYSKQAAEIKSKRSVIGVLRLVVVVLAIIVIKFSWQEALWIILTEAAVFIALFLYAVSVDVDEKEKFLNLERLIQINNDEMDVLAGNFLQRPDGAQFLVPQHPYANDLDIVGPASIYQYINRCTGEQAKRLLADSLLAPATKEAILLKQQAVKEISGKTAWRQQLQSYGVASPITVATEKKINNWLQQPAVFTSKGWWWLARIFPVISLGSILLYLNDTIPSAIFWMLAFCFFIFAFSLSKKIHPTWMLLSKIVPEADTLNRQLEYIETENFSSTFVANIQTNLQNQQGVQASKEIKHLKAVLNRFDVRLNIFAFYFLNTFLLWDLWQILALNDWKNKNQQSVTQWFKAIAEMEAVSSVATLAFNQPAWCYPVIADAHFTLHTVDAGHPLIPADKRVNNSYGLQGIGKVSVITGSNMGGKSTFLRSIGVNIVLAMAGSPVCASSFTVSVVKLMSSMRIADNLAESTSTFYAELKKLKSIIDAVNEEQKIFILLDEILRGTNSLDRHTGSRALIKQLVHKNAVATIATHDVELAKLEEEMPQAISNYHFDVQVANDELYFDYKLKTGICTSLNASILMRKIGIELEQK